MKKYPQDCAKHVICVAQKDFTINDAYQLLVTPEEWHLHFRIQSDKDAENRLNEMRSQIQDIANEINQIDDEDIIQIKYDIINFIQNKMYESENNYPTRCAENLMESYIDHISKCKKEKNLMIQKALNFVNEWRGTTSEDGEAKTFWDQFFTIFGISRRKVAVFEKRIKMANGKFGYIDLFWPGKLLVEHKSLGKDLSHAIQQALSYCDGINEKERPQYILVSDFCWFILIDLKTQQRYEFKIEQLPENLHLFNFLLDGDEYIKQEDPVNFEAIHALGEIADELIRIGYPRNDTQIFLTRLIFCFFAEDTGIFNKDQFTNYVLNHTQPDGSDLSIHIQKLFGVLNMKTRGAYLHENLCAFPYVNGGLFEDSIHVPDLNARIRRTILDAGDLDWRLISPAIFGTLFQSILDPSERRKFGAHFTSEDVILKTIYSLYMDELWDEFNRYRSNKAKMRQLHDRIASMHILDPACGSGNFLIVAYRELRRLEIKILEQLIDTRNLYLDIEHLQRVDISHFHGIEIEEWPAYIAKVAMWIMEHLMNMEMSAKFGQNYVKIPLTSTADIHVGNALTLEWPHADYIIGNPPFSGKKLMGNDRKEELIATGANANLDYVCGWFYKACDIMCKNPEIEAAFVATSSIMQGEQATSLWKPLFEKGIEIKFGYKPFKWNNEAKKKAAVWVVIVGFGKKHFQNKYIYDGDGYKNVSNINHYLLDMESVFIEPRRVPLSNVSQIIYGSAPYDGGNLLLSQEEYNDIVQKYPETIKYIHPYIGADEFLYGYKRYCLWLKEHDWNEFMRFNFIKERVMAVKGFRENAKSRSTNEFAIYPHLFKSERQPNDCDILVIPGVTSENRKYIPIGFIDSNTVISNACQIVPNATLYEFGIITSSIHNIWVHYVSGRLESRIRYSAVLTYNTFPWPDVIDEQKEKVARMAQKILNARALYPNMCLADLYGELMPPELAKAHYELDQYVLGLYGIKENANDEDIFRHLVQVYKRLVFFVTRIIESLAVPRARDVKYRVKKNE